MMCQEDVPKVDPLPVDVLLSVCEQTDTPFKHVSLTTYNESESTLSNQESNFSISSTSLVNNNETTNIQNDKKLNRKGKKGENAKKSQKNTSNSTKNNVNINSKQPAQDSNLLPNSFNLNDFYNGKNLAKFFPFPQFSGLQSRDLSDARTLMLMLLTQNQIMMQRLKSQDFKIEQLLAEIKKIKKDGDKTT